MVFPSTENEAVRNSAALRTEFARATSHPNRPHRSNLHSVKVPRGENTKSIQSKNVTSLLPNLILGFSELSRLKCNSRKIRRHMIIDRHLGKMRITKIFIVTNDIQLTELES